MKVIAEIDETEVDVEIVRDGDAVTATVDGRTYQLEVTCPEDVVLLIKNSGIIAEAKISNGEKDTFKVDLNGREYSVKIIDPRKLRSTGDDGDQSTGPAQIKTAMPGKVVKILTQLGAEINKGDGVIVVEAMKMQNELKAPRNGTVQSVNVAEGDTVNAGDTLLVIE